MRHWQRHFSWLNRLGLVVVDEFHLLMDPGRGPRLEGAISRLQRVNPFCRVMGLSATVSNHADLAAWLGGVSYHSTWRPIPLEHEVRRYKRLADKIGLVIEIVAETQKSGGQTLVFASSRRRAEQKREELGVDIPIVGTGHLFTAGGQTIDGDGVRELYVGSLAHVTTGIFPASFDYLALGHLHVPQKVNGCETIRYSGSPLPMGFGEAKQQKSVCQVEFLGTAASVQLIDVPVFQKLERVKGDWVGISSRIRELSATNTHCWLEAIYDGNEVLGDLRERLEAAISGTQMEMLRIKNNRIIDRVLEQSHEEETLEDLNVNDVFERCLAVHEVSDDQRAELLWAFQETVSSLHEDDVQAE